MSLADMIAPGPNVKGSRGAVGKRQRMAQKRPTVVREQSVSKPHREIVLLIVLRRDNIVAQELASDIDRRVAEERQSEQGLSVACFTAACGVETWQPTSRCGVVKGRAHPNQYLGVGGNKSKQNGEADHLFWLMWVLFVCAFPRQTRCLPR